MNDVFISYSRRDKVFTQKLYEALTAANRSVWADWDSIPAASDWDAEIKQGIQETNSVLFVLSPEWIKSNECRKEMVHAVSMGKRLFPILYLPVDPNDVPPELAKINWVYMREGDDFDKAFQTLCSAMDTDLDWIKTHTRIQVRALEWEKKNRSASFALRGEDLTEGEQFIAGAANKNPVPTHLQSEYILASRTDATRRQRQTLAGVTVALIVSIALGIAAFFQRQEAVAQKATAQANLIVAQTARSDADNNAATAVANEQEAKRQAQIALARQLAAQAQSLLADQPELSELLAIKSMQLFPARDSSQILETNPLGQFVSKMSYGGWTTSVAFSPDGKYAISGGCDKAEGSFCNHGTARVWLADSGKEVSQMSYAGEVSAVAFSPDGKYVVSGGCDEYKVDAKWICAEGSSRVWLADTGKEIARIGYSGGVYSVAFSSDGKNILSVGYDTVSVVIANTGKEISHKTYSLHAASAAFSPDGKYVVSGGDNIVQVWAADTGKEISHKNYGNDSYPSVNYVAFSPNGKYIASAVGNTVYVWDAMTGQDVSSNTHDSYTAVVFVTFSPDGKLIASGEGYSWGNGGSSMPFSTFVWETLTGKDTAHITHDIGHGIRSISFNPDGRYIVSGSGDQTSRVWESLTGKDVAYIQQPARAAVFSPDGKYVALGGGKETSLWSVNTGIEISRITKEGRVTSVAFSPDGKSAISGGCDKYDENYNCIQSSIRVWDAYTGTEISNIKTDNEILSMILSPDGKYVVVDECDEKNGFQVCSKGSIHSLAVNTGNELFHFEFAEEDPYYFYDINRVTYSPNGKYILLRANNTVRVLAVDTKKEVFHMTYKGYVYSAAFSPDSKAVVASGCDKYDATVSWICIQGFIHAWMVNSGNEIIRMEQQGTVTSVAFSPDGKYLISAGGCEKYNETYNCIRGVAHVLQASTGTELFYVIYDGFVTTAAFSPDGKYIVTGGCDKQDNIGNAECLQGSARVWSMQTEIEVSRTTFGGQVYSISFSPDGTYAISTGCDKYYGFDGALCMKSTARVWMPTTGQEVARIVHEGKINSIAFSSDGKYVVSGGADATARIWLYRPDDLITNACSRVLRNLTRAEWAQFIGDAMPYQAVCENLPIEPEVTATPTVTP